MRWAPEKTQNRFHLLLLCICQLTASKVHAFGRMAALRNHPMASTAITSINVRVCSQRSCRSGCSNIKMHNIYQYRIYSAKWNRICRVLFFFLDWGRSGVSVELLATTTSPLLPLTTLLYWKNFFDKKSPEHPLFLTPASGCQRRGVVTCIQSINLTSQRMICGFACKLHEEKRSKFQKKTSSNSKRQAFKGKSKNIAYSLIECCFQMHVQAKILVKGVCCAT